MKPLLTIAIPTYNRASCLSLLLKYLAPQLRTQPDVELVISDNASQDRTREVVDEHQQAGLGLRYLCNSKNLGADANILQCFTLATGRYVWILGDDDVLVPGGLSRVLNLLRRDDYGLLFVTSRSFRESFVPPPEPQGDLSTITFSDPEALARKVHIFFTFISGNIVNKEALDPAVISSCSDLIGSNLVQLGWIYSALEGHRKTLYIRDALVAAKEDNTGGYGLCQTFGQSLHKITTERLSSPRVQQIILNSSIQRLLPPFLLKTRFGANAFTSESAHSILAPIFGSNYRYWFFIYPILKLPSNLAAFWFRMMRVVDRVDRSLGSPLLT